MREFFISFSATSNEELLVKVNAWHQENETVNILKRMFSTNSVSELIEYQNRPEMVGPASTEFHVAIWYRLK